jgi:glycosyltransferase involved in cell wall biosynthesis
LQKKAFHIDDSAKLDLGGPGECKIEPIVPTDPLVTVVIPTYNRAAQLTCAIQSVLNQTYENLEIIVVDDASADDTQRIVESFADSRIRYIRHKVNRGGSAARNTGIRAATGKYIAFLDDDDEWESVKTEEQIRILEDQDYDAVLCTSDEHGARLSKFEGEKTIDLENLRRGRFTAGGTGVLMAKANVVKETMFDESLPRYQDWDVFIRIGQKYRIGYLNKPFVRYNEGAHERISNKIISMPASALENELQMVHKHREFFGEKWFKLHVCRFMLYGIKNRPDKAAHISYMIKNYGVQNVIKALARRFWQKAIQKL